MKLLALVLIILAFSGCATVPPEKVELIWRKVASQYPGADVEMPRVTWVDEDIYVVKKKGEVFCNGAYKKSNNTVYLRKWWADEETVAHEFRHVHGDRQGEEYGRLVLK